MIKICENCGKTFETNRENKRFCCRRCKENNSKKRIKNGIRYDNIEYTKVCIDCGKTFVTKHCDKIRCNECRKIHERQVCKEYYQKNKEYFKEYQKQYQQEHKDKYIKYYTHICLTCGREYSNRSRNETSTYCEECIQNKQFKHICEQCGKEYISDRRFYSLCNTCVEESKLKDCVCKVCGATFKSHYSSSVFCSDKCRKIDDNRRAKEYRDNPVTRKKYNDSHRKSKQKRLKEDIEYKLKNNIYGRIWGYLKRYGKSKQRRTLEYVNYTMGELKKHLESMFEPDMTWDNHGILWHIDHIKPQASFKFINDDGTENIDAIKECWNLSNLQPLYIKDNLSKSSWYNGKYYRNGCVVEN